MEIRNWFKKLESRNWIFSIFYFLFNHFLCEPGWRFGRFLIYPRSLDAGFNPA
jgi:hypothetical protein